MQRGSSFFSAVVLTILSTFGPLTMTTLIHAQNLPRSIAVPGPLERGTTTNPLWQIDTSGLANAGTLTVRCETYVDDDADGLDDGVENCALNKHAPVVYLPLGLDWTRPANVDWYLTRSALRFHHNNCNDEQILGIGGVTQSRLVAQYHRRKNGAIGFSPCSHYGNYIYSDAGPYVDDHHFFLQPNDATHAGSSNPADWIVYAHVYPNDIGGMNVQYWFFYAYNDNFGSANHEGDWESITVRLEPSGKPAGIYVCQHGSCGLRTDIAWYTANGHPTIWSADGSHASYTTEAKCDAAGVMSEGGGDNCETVAANRWFTWKGGRGSQSGHQGGGIINVGERDRPLNNQHFIRFYAKWGENGAFDDTSGPRTPTYQDSWNVGGL